jgi:hypothetical protein
MGTGYTRNDTANNIADGNVINASDLDGEFDAIQAAFNASTGHSHDGTTGEGPQIGTGGIADNAVTLGTKTTGNYVATGAVSGVGLSGSASAEGATFTVTSNATDANTASTIVARDASGNFSAGDVTVGNLITSGNVDGRDVSADGTKLDGIESGATADQTASEILTLIKTVDGSGSGLDADTLDGVSSASFLRSDTADTKTAGDLTFSDNVKAKFGGGGDLEIYHDNPNGYSVIRDVGVGDLEIHATDFSVKNADRTATYMGATNGGAVTLRYAGGTKLATKSDGVDITGELQADSLDIDGAGDITGNLTLGGNLDMQDNDKILLGTGDDLQIYHDGSNSFIDDAGTGNLLIRSNRTIIQKYTGEVAGDFVADGEAALYYDNNKKIATTSSGIDVTGDVLSDTFTLDNGASDWQFSVVSNNLIISYAGTAKMKLDTSGNLTVTGDVISEGTI